MGDDPVFEKLSAILVKILGEDIQPVCRDAHLIDDLEADSMDLVEMADHAEEVFGITFRTSELKDMQTVADVLAYLSAKLK